MPLSVASSIGSLFQINLVPFAYYVSSITLLYLASVNKVFLVDECPLSKFVGLTTTLKNSLASFG